ncbi:bisphosphoglycerate-dependent phosphoglycerate mutase [Rhodoblastus acidophilus]|uniref:hypothetical protein n=1 Tax=Rhodoblastus acidophilus TaxID=1074 RepID=UPI00222401BC|nr:hypothetical protein [Rhodoblastus acidophilus]MCW2318569.1 bisphosphoglycerate-dependent phosphoglycerate mutase [Rhodoblastus acidophilus]
MIDTSHSHEAIAWLKQRLDELDAIILEIEKSAAGQSAVAQAEAQKALARIQAARLAFQTQYETLRARAEQTPKAAQDALDDEWIEVEAALQSFLAATADQADAIRGIVIARAAVQRRAWDASVESLAAQANETVEKGRQEFDAVMRRLSEHAEKFQAGFDQAKDVGEESWTALKVGLAEVKAVHDRTMEKVKSSVARLF